jgi:hypothetical protein
VHFLSGYFVIYVLSFGFQGVGASFYKANYVDGWALGCWAGLFLPWEMQICSELPMWFKVARLEELYSQICDTPF